MDSSLPLAKWGGGDNPEIPRMIDVTGAGSRNDAHRVQLRLVNRAFERYVRYRRGRNEKNESRTVFENLKAAVLENHATLPLGQIRAGRPGQIYRVDA